MTDSVELIDFKERKEEDVPKVVDIDKVNANLTEVLIIDDQIYNLLAL